MEVVVTDRFHCTHTMNYGTGKCLPDICCSILWNVKLLRIDFDEGIINVWAIPLPQTSAQLDKNASLKILLYSHLVLAVYNCNICCQFDDTMYLFISFHLDRDTYSICLNLGHVFRNIKISGLDSTVDTFLQFQMGWCVWLFIRLRWEDISLQSAVFF